MFSFKHGGAGAEKLAPFDDFDTFEHEGNVRAYAEWLVDRHQLQHYPERDFLPDLKSLQMWDVVVVVITVCYILDVGEKGL